MRTNNKLKLEMQLEILEMLGILLEIGFSLNSSIEIMNTKFDVERWQQKLLAGATFYQVLADDQFDADVLLIIKIGLDSESFSTTINKSIKLIVSKLEKRNELIELFKYPLMLIVIAGVSVGFVSYFLLPQFEQILNSMGVESQMTTTLYKLFRAGPYIITVLIALILIVAVICSRLDYDRRLKLLVRFRLIRKLYVSIYNQVFTISIANLLKTQLPLSSVISVLSNQTENKLLAAEAQKIEVGLQQGKYISECVSEIYYDRQLLSILRLGEETGMLVYYLDSYSKLIATINQNRGKRIIFWIQPLFYLSFGILILLLYAAIFIPMFSLMDSI